MKKLLLIAGLLLLPLTRSYALWERPDYNTAVYATSALTTSTAAVVVDLSDTSGYPHRLDGQVNVAGVRLDVYKAASSSGTIKVGVVTRVNATSGDVKWFYTFNFSQDAAGTKYTDTFITPDAPIRAQVKSDGTTPNIVSNNITTSSTTYQNDVVLPTSSNSNVAPGVGDIVVDLTNSGSGAVNFTLGLNYYTDK